MAKPLDPFDVETRIFNKRTPTPTQHMRVYEQKKKTTVGEYNFCLMFSFIERYIRVVAITMNGDEKRCPKCGKAIIHLFVDRMPLVR